MGKAILLVIDSFGIGAMEDSNPIDRSANTYKHIRDASGLLHIPTLLSLGLGALAEDFEPPENAYGYAALAHHGADTYLGHQEIAGSCPGKSNKRFMKDIHSSVADALRKAGYNVQYPIKESPVLLVDGSCVIGDNLESAPGNIINVTADLKKIPFNELKKVGEIVRGCVDTSRVIAFGGPYTSIEHIISVVHEKSPGHWGVDAPKAKVYGKGYEVYHMGYGVDINSQFPMIAAKSGLKVYRIGKTADVLHGEGPAFPIVDTDEVLEKLRQCYLRENEDAAFLVNVQETDLAGHAEDPYWYATLLNKVDRWLAEFLPLLGIGDIIIIMADHGNDPTIGHSNHTREYVPILAAGPKIKKSYIGERQSMADVGATLSDFFGLQSTAEGESFLKNILIP